MNFKEICLRFNIGELTMEDIIANLEKPDMDIRKTVEPVVLKRSFKD